MDQTICSQCGANFPRFEDVKKNGRLVEADWSLEDKPTCPKCRGLKGTAVPKKDVLGGYPPERRAELAKGGRQ
jgi:hypothetical protein